MCWELRSSTARTPSKNNHPDGWGHLGAGTSKALGIHWNVTQDQFHVAVPPTPVDVAPTKRTIASTTAKIFDILGLFSPITITAKILLQQLWKLHLDWDTPVPDTIATEWQRWISTVPAIASHPINRRLRPLDVPILSQQIHGFSDASANAYGAVVYLRTVYQNADVSIVLITSKARVSPVRPVTIPRLELTAAYLLSKLLLTVSTDLNIPIHDVYAWTDSTIVLSWVNKSPTNLKVFVANRIASIQDVIPPRQWRHVRSKDNPADLASRGVSTSDLLNSTLWWGRVLLGSRVLLQIGHSYSVILPSRTPLKLEPSPPLFKSPVHLMTSGLITLHSTISSGSWLGHNALSPTHANLVSIVICQPS